MRCRACRAMLESLRTCVFPAQVHSVWAHLPPYRMGMFCTSSRAWHLAGCHGFTRAGVGQPERAFCHGSGLVVSKATPAQTQSSIRMSYTEGAYRRKRIRSAGVGG